VGISARTTPAASLTLADAYATAAYAMGTAAVDWIDTVDGYEAFLVGAGGAQSSSARWEGSVAPIIAAAGP
jgi:thiamine biosynthesis lipoprotein